jgi:hypothetical protein
MYNYARGEGKSSPKGNILIYLFETNRYVDLGAKGERKNQATVPG